MAHKACIQRKYCVILIFIIASILPSASFADCSWNRPLDCFESIGKKIFGGVKKRAKMIWEDPLGSAINPIKVIDESLPTSMSYIEYSLKNPDEVIELIKDPVVGVIGMPLAIIIADGRNSALKNGTNKIPPHVKEDLMPYFDEQILDSVRYSSGKSFFNGLAQGIALNTRANAITLINVIVFKDKNDAIDNSRLWAHEMFHVRQYRELGLSKFAATYTLSPTVDGAIEKPAYDFARNISITRMFDSLGGDLASAPAVVHTGSGRLEVFVRGRHGDDLVQRTWNGTKWSGWKNHGGDLASAPAVVHTGSGRLEVFVRGRHGDDLVQRTWNGTKWSGWKNHGGDLASAPAVVHTGSGRLEVFVRGRHGDDLVQRTWNGTKWSGWKNHGGDLASAPAVVHTGSGRLEVFVRGRHGDDLVQRTWNGTKWSGWKNHGGDLASAPAVVHTGSGRLEVFVRGRHGDDLVQRTWNGTKWSGWKNHGGTLASTPAVVRRESGKLEVFVRWSHDDDLLQYSIP